MKKIVTDSQRKEVRGFISKWQPLLFLHQWDFSISFHDNPDEKWLEITMQTVYKKADIAINVHSYFSEKDKEYRERMIVHELCHCLVQPMVEVACEAAGGRQVSQSEIDWHKESVTEHIATSIFYKKL